MKGCADFQTEVSIPWDDVIETVGSDLLPEEVFSTKDLEIWASDNGWVREEE